MRKKIVEIWSATRAHFENAKGYAFGLAKLTWLQLTTRAPKILSKQAVSVIESLEREACRLNHIGDGSAYFAIGVRDMILVPAMKDGFAKPGQVGKNPYITLYADSTTGPKLAVFTGHDKEKLAEVIDAVMVKFINARLNGETK